MIENRKTKRLLAAVVAIIVLAGIVIVGIFSLTKLRSMYNNVLTKIDSISASLSQSGTQTILASRLYSFSYDWVETRQPVAHALGGIDGNTYTNSKEAFEYNYDKGLRVFEADFQLTAEGVLVLLHDWPHFRSITGNEALDEPMSYAQFKSQTIMGRYTPLTCEDLMALMLTHPDAYIITDTKDKDIEFVKAQMSQLVWHAHQFDPAILDRIIIQIYSEEMLHYVMDAYPFSSVLITLYQFGSWRTDEDIINYCLSNGIRVVTVPLDRMNAEFATKINNAGLYSYVHTVNDFDRIWELLDMGVTGIYTDFATPDDFRVGVNPVAD